MARRLTAAILGLALDVHAAPAPLGTLVEAGGALYRRYCAACHGVDGRGNGPVSPAIGERIPDLTQIARRHGGRFPFLGTMRVIDGTTALRAHGVSEMPVWGEVFSPQATWSAAQQAEARGKIVLITEYLRSIQAK